MWSTAGEVDQLEGLSDRQAVRRLETDIAACKAAAGLAVTDEAFHPTVLVLWRNKLRASEAPERIFDAIRAVITASGVIATKTRRALDSTVLGGAVQRQDTVTILVTLIRPIRRLHARAGHGVVPPAQPRGPAARLHGGPLGQHGSAVDQCRGALRQRC